MTSSTGFLKLYFAISPCRNRRLIDFLAHHQGRLKCIGRVTKPEARYLPLKFESKAITCKDIINTVIIFSEVRNIVSTGCDVQFVQTGVHRVEPGGLGWKGRGEP